QPAAADYHLKAILNQTTSAIQAHTLTATGDQNGWPGLYGRIRHISTLATVLRPGSTPRQRYSCPSPQTGSLSVRSCGLPGWATDREYDHFRSAQRPPEFGYQLDAGRRSAACENRCRPGADCNHGQCSAEFLDQQQRRKDHPEGTQHPAY